MRNCKRMLALLIVLCTVLPICLAQVSADKMEPVAYDFFCDELKDLTYDQKGGASFNKAKNDLNSLYAQGTLNAIPVAFSSKSSPYINSSEHASDGIYTFNGIRQLKTTTGDWVAIKFRSPGEGFFSVSFKYYYHNANSCAAITGYLLPANTATDSIGSLLTEERALGTADILSTSTSKQISTLRLTTGAELEKNKEYILVLQSTTDHFEPDTARVDFLLTGLEFGEGYEPGEGAFNPIRGQILSEETVKIAQFYRAQAGVNPANGHDLLYLMIKGGDMLVYDVDEQEIVDTKTDIHRQQKGSCIDPDGNLWICGSSNLIYKYNPATKESTKYKWDLRLVDGNQVESYGIVYGDDGYLYFGYYGWLLRMDPKTGETERISERLTLDDKPSDAQFTGHGGIVYKDGYLYLSIHGDMNTDLKHTSAVIKYDIANRKIVQAIDVLDAAWGVKNQYTYGIANLNYMDGILYGTFSNRPDVPVYIDISGDEMVRLEKVEGLNTHFVGTFVELDGKYYMAGYVDEKESTKCLYEYDPATKTFKRIQDVFFWSVPCYGGVVTLDDENMPGLSIVAPSNNSSTGMMDVYFYNLESLETVTYSGISKGYGTGVSLNPIGADPTGRYIFTGGYGSNLLGIYDTVTGEVEMWPSYDHQIDSLMWYGDFLWIGNYHNACITRFDMDTKEAFPLFKLMETVFQQVRMLNPTAGDGKVFFAGEPDANRFGGVLAWYDIEQDLTYIAAGPNPEDVYYARTTGSFNVWRNVVTHEIEDFDDNGDGMFDYDILIDDLGDDDPANDIKKQKFTGVVHNRILINMNYVDGYIIGSTTKTNGKTAYDKEGNAELFVYDVNNFKLVATYDITQVIDGLGDLETGKLPLIDAVAPDPYEKGKFWGVAVDTLFSFTFDFDTNTFNVKEEVSFNKGMEHKAHGSKMGTDILFDGDYMYISTQHMGTYMVHTADTSVYYQLSGTGTAEMIQLPDGDIYYLSGRDGVNSDIKVFRCAQVTQPLVIRSAQAVIDALPDAVTMADEEQVMAAYHMYMDMIDASKAQLNTDKLMAAVAALEEEQVAKAESLIDAIGAVTLESLTAIQTARWYYESIPEAAQAKVTKLTTLDIAKLEYDELWAAQAKSAVKPDPEPEPDAPASNDSGNKNTVTIVIIAVAAVVLAAGVAVAVILVRKKSKKDAAE